MSGRKAKRKCAIIGIEEKTKEGDSMFTRGIVELDVHNMTWIQAKMCIDSRLKKEKKDVYVLRIIHGYNKGTALRDKIRKEYRGNAKVKRVELSVNQGITDLVLRDLF